MDYNGNNIFGGNCGKNREKTASDKKESPHCGNVIERKYYIYMEGVFTLPLILVALVFLAVGPVAFQLILGLISSLTPVFVIGGIVFLVFKALSNK